MKKLIPTSARLSAPGKEIYGKISDRLEIRTRRPTKGLAVIITICDSHCWFSALTGMSDINVSCFNVKEREERSGQELCRMDNQIGLERNTEESSETDKFTDFRAGINFR